MIVRSTGAGVHAGYLKSLKGNVAELVNARRLWRWVVAKQTGQLASLSEAAVHGLNTSDTRSRVAVTVPSQTVLGVCEILDCSDAARESIEAAP